MRLIDAYKLIAKLHGTEFMDGDDRSIVYAIIENMPTVDAVPVIRCKDCTKKELCSIFRDARQELGFCAWAERKEE